MAWALCGALALLVAVLIWDRRHIERERRALSRRFHNQLRGSDE